MVWCSASNRFPGRSRHGVYGAAGPLHMSGGSTTRFCGSESYDVFPGCRGSEDGGCSDLRNDPWGGAKYSRPALKMAERDGTRKPLKVLARPDSLVQGTLSPGIERPTLHRTWVLHAPRSAWSAGPHIRADVAGAGPGGEVRRAASLVLRAQQRGHAIQRFIAPADPRILLTKIVRHARHHLFQTMVRLPCKGSSSRRGRAAT